MKKKFFFAALVAASMLASCSSDDVVVENSPVSFGEDGYVAFNIQMPSSNASRSNDQFSDGDPIPAEYAVNNASLYLFKGAKTAPEGNATFVAKYSLNVKNFATVGTAVDQCTSDGIASQKITAPEIDKDTEYLYAYVVLNDNGLTGSSKALDGASLTSTTTFTNFSKILLDNIGSIAHGFVMTNCPVNNGVAGASAPTKTDITTLAKLDPEKIFPTEAEAEGDPAGEIYVERAAAKVTVSRSTSLSGKLTAKNTVEYKKDGIKWELLNQNTKYYNNRQMKADWLGLAAITANTDKKNEPGATYNTANLYRFASAAAIHPGVVRTYWGEDVNYADGKQDLFSANPTSFTKDVTKEGVSVYTFENTFDVKHQSSVNTTMVGFAVPFNEGEDFYTVNKLGVNDIVLTPGSSKSGTKVQDFVSDYLQHNNTLFKTWYDENTAASKPTDLTITMANNTDGTAEIASIATDASATPLDASIDVAYLNDLFKFTYYKGGVAYYNARIKHFGAELNNEAETPWLAANHTESSIEGVYYRLNELEKATPGAKLSDGEADQNYLGRYGVLRNNWYQLELGAIKNIGKPLPGDPSKKDDPFFPETPDDEVENYIAVKVHVTPWALRKQSVTL